MTSELLKELISLSKDKQFHLKKILEITKKQQQVIEKSDTDRLQAYITKKQKEIDCIDKLDIKFTEIYERIKKNNNVTSLDELNTEYHPYLKELKDIVEEITNLLKNIQEIELENNKKIKREFQQVKEKLKNVKQGKKMVKGYSAYKKPKGSIFINQKK
ncbi:flagellar protein FlgN [Caldisalinibacter kiritimatiensis]|uniref:FlgN protein n=1 Tax=Caldisalinibacter kiritimatiensis TaxID=1304284 RepID=R1CUN7_9FIRM|nr:flagellar protein FlgN [Caldisalinibacter kiritimatiensis]EOD00379.1 hypothetical protein L21TH_1583 [Caldisalinibacter kiritimatiensis]